MDAATILFLTALFALGAARPHWGLSIVAALLPIASVLPGDLTAGTLIFASPVAVAGAAAVAGAGFRLLRDGQLGPQLVFGDRVRLLSLLFIAWLFFTHPAAAWFGEGDRNWVLTFAQLWVLLVLAGAALGTPEKQRFLMAVFGAACLLSAHVAILGGAIGESREVRSAGFAAGVNTASRYFVVGIVFWLFLAAQAKQRWVKVLGLLAAAYLMLGVLFTQSRSGLILGLTAIVALPLVATRRRLTGLLVSLAMLLLVWTALVPSGTLDAVSQWFTREGVAPSADLDSVGNNIRYYLWEAGVQMWRQSPIAGIGIGEFPFEAPAYVRVATRNPTTVMSAHNMFIRLLSETGVVGLALFCGVIFICLRRVWLAPATSDSGPGNPSAAWLVTMVVLLVGAVLKDDTVEKLLWLAMGVASSYGLTSRAPEVTTRPFVTTVPVRRGLVRTRFGLRRRTSMARPHG